MGEATVPVPFRPKHDWSYLEGRDPRQRRSVATIMTDEWVGFKEIGKEFEGGHRTVNHHKDGASVIKPIPRSERGGP